MAMETGFGFDPIRKGKRRLRLEMQQKLSQHFTVGGDQARVESVLCGALDNAQAFGGIWVDRVCGPEAANILLCVGPCRAGDDCASCVPQPYGERANAAASAEH